MTLELRDGPFQLWEDFKGLFNDGDNYCLLANSKLGYTAGFIVRGYDPVFRVERILAIPLDVNGQAEQEQMLFEFWDKGIFEGKLAISKVSAEGELVRLGLPSFPPDMVIEDQDLVGFASKIAAWLAGLKDESWRNMVKEVLGRNSAQ